MADRLDIFVALGLSVLVSLLLIRWSARDAPDGGRKDHARPVATAGGLAIALGHLVPILWQRLAQGDVQLSQGGWLGVGAPLALALPLIALAFLTIGFIDDIRSMPARVKLALMAALSLFACALGAGAPLSLIAPSIDPLWLILLVPGGALWLFVIANATNFMDGSNGLAMGSAAVMLVFLGQLIGPVDTLVLAILGFLLFNLSGRLFAGDTGALYVGFWLGALGLLGVWWGQYSVWIPPLIVLPFLTDVLLTLAWRARHGRRLMDAHREHAYQLFRRAGWGHLQVAVLWWAMSAACGALAVWTAGRATQIEFAAFAGALGVSMVLWLWQRAVYWPRVSAPG